MQYETPSESVAGAEVDRGGSLARVINPVGDARSRFHANEPTRLPRSGTSSAHFPLTAVAKTVSGKRAQYPFGGTGTVSKTALDPTVTRSISVRGTAVTGQLPFIAR